MFSWNPNSLFLLTTKTRANTTCTLMSLDVVNWRGGLSDFIMMKIFTKLLFRNTDKYNLEFRLFPMISVLEKYTKSIDVLPFSFFLSSSSHWWLGEIVCSGRWINRYLLVWMKACFPFKTLDRFWCLASVFLTQLECCSKSISSSCVV